MAESHGSEFPREAMLAACDALVGAEDAIAFPSYASGLSYLHRVKQLLSSPECSSAAAFFLSLNRMEGAALYCGARVMQAAHPKPSSQSVAELSVAANETRVFPGTLVVKGSLQNNGILIVLGDLEVGGEYADGDVGSALVVLGSLQARVINIYGATCIGGDATADMVYGVDHSAGVFIGGRLRATLLVANDKTILAKEIDARATAGMSDDHEGEREALTAVLLPELLIASDEQEDDELPIEVDTALERARRGEALLLKESRQKP